MSSDSKPDIFTYADFDLQALCHKASTLRQGVSCVCRPDQRPCSGSFNWAIFISFEDGIRWVFRSPHPRPFISIEIGMKLLASEATTLRYLRAHSDVPVPEVYNYYASSENDIGVPFIIMSETQGQLLSKIWRPASSPQLDLDTPSKARMLIYYDLKKIGLLFEKDRSFEIKTCLSRGHILYGRYNLKILCGSFTSETEFYNSLSDFITAKRKPDSLKNRLDYIIAANTLRDIIPRLKFLAVNPKTLPPELVVPFINGFITAIPGSIEKSLIHKYRESLERAQVSWRLSRLLNLDSIMDIKQYFLQQRRSPHYIQLYNEVQEKNQPLSKIEKDEKGYFQNKVIINTIAKKLTLVSEWKTKYTANNPPKLQRDMFVASPNLWKWIQRFMQDWEDMLDTSTKESRF
ncbi:hypothetical protein BDV32DRAFT_140028 [Aspergillus pseudonomiae]|uniref:Aminoglycoside phosphotransferase domain-containing protein n=1 Tax=Aspergillus pseudonomiae TaxID=1506151 RepID=A0A5N7DNR5_9EURO|nr:uncharacterized protein BDV37DRAFT_268849 [Aspergillus pseudonomiae]KAB8257899.1 hypothetical protein BDV32DRAFT_140028 [Aspergillus pseudonomiae]KAE8408111.1 hypothetical protein BDV37DRAFT_268849 [Aspergillus pseudonomiae]